VADSTTPATDAAEALRDIEAIKQLKARYCRHLDAKDWVSWRALYHETYEKRDRKWRITSSRLTRLREDIALPGIRALPPSVARRLRIAAAKMARRTSVRAADLGVGHRHAFDNHHGKVQ
jgi:hypothetical protein